ncbi:MAG: hypothetical protein ACU0CO_12595 [Shimia sp.]
MSRRLFILNGHPASLSRAAASADATDAAGQDTRLHYVADLNFDPDHGIAGYKGAKPLEPAPKPSSGTSNGASIW